MLILCKPSQIQKKPTPNPNKWRGIALLNLTLNIISSIIIK